VPEQIAEGDLSPVRGAPVSMLRSLRCGFILQTKKDRLMRPFGFGRAECVSRRLFGILLRQKPEGILPGGKNLRYFAFAKT